jgi:hypothetical protein
MDPSRGWAAPAVVEVRSQVSLGPGGAGGVKQSTFCMAHRKTMITMGSPYFVWINTNGIISSWCLLGAVCVTPSPVALSLQKERHRTCS